MMASKVIMRTVALAPLVQVACAVASSSSPLALSASRFAEEEKATMPSDVILTPTSASDDGVILKHNPPSETVHLEWRIMTDLFIVAYTMLVLSAIVHFISLLVRRLEKPRWTYIFSGLLTIGALVRISYFSIIEVEDFGFQITNPSIISAQVNYLLNSVPSFLFFSAYLVLLFFWAELYHSGFKLTNTKRATMGRFLPWYMALNTVVYLVISVLYGLDLAVSPIEPHPREQNFTKYQFGVQLIMGSIYVILAIAFTVYGLLLHRMARKYTTRMPKTMKKLAAICAITIVGFLARGSLILLSLAGLVPYDWWIVLINWILFEVTPLSLVFFLLTNGTITHQRHRDVLTGAQRHRQGSHSEKQPLTQGINNDIYIVSSTSY